MMNYQGYFADCLQRIETAGNSVKTYDLRGVMKIERFDKYFFRAWCGAIKCIEILAFELPIFKVFGWMDISWWVTLLPTWGTFAVIALVMLGQWIYDKFL